MSASSKKKLRKEQNAAALTEKQRKAQAEAKKLKVSSTLFIIVMAVILVIGLTVMIVRGVQGSGIIEKNTIALTVGEHKLNSVVMNYYYTDTVSNTYNEWNSMYGEATATWVGMMGLDVTKPLDEQIYTDGQQTWADYFMGIAVERATADYLVYDIAMAENYTLSAEDKLNLESKVNYNDLYAMYNGMDDVNDYMVAVYGPGATRDSYYDYAEVSAIASAYYNGYADTLEYDEAAIRAYEAGNEINYNSYTYASYYLSYAKFVEEGLTDPTPEQIAAASALAKAEAEKLISATNVEELDAAIAALPINAESTTAASTKYNDTLYTSTNSVIRQWISDPARQENDITMIANEVTSADEHGHETTTINGYYVVLFQSSSKNLEPMGNVRHLLVKFEGGTTDENNTTVYSDAEKAAAKEKADGYLNTWKSGDATEDSFIELVQQYSQDGSAPDGGLFEDVNPGSLFVESFLNWSIDPNRVAGDTEVIESEYGYHVMYYVGDDELSYRDYLIVNEMREADLTSWYDGVIAAGTVVEGNLSRVKTDKVLAGQ